MNINVYIVVNRKNIICRVNGCKHDFHFDALQRCIPAYIKRNAICCRVICFCKRSSLCKLKHAASAYETNRNILTVCRNICLFCSTIFYRQRRFNILHIILRKRENFIYIGRSNKLHRCTAAAPVSNLKALIHRCARCNADISAAGNIAPCIEVAAVFNRNLAAAVHFDLPIRTCRFANMAI